MENEALQATTPISYGMTMDSSVPVRELFEEHHRVVVQAAYRITGNAEDAEDVLQTVFVRLLKRNQLPDLLDKPRSYLRRAAVNAALDIVRAKKSSRRIPLESVEDFLPQQEESHPDEIRSRTELRQWLRGALGRIHARAAEIFVLKYFEGYTNQEIAGLIGTSPGTISVTLHRTRNKLQREIQSFLGENR
jgi:RNA polymerase sigma-70 factor (ECF subfamily)